MDYRLRKGETFTRWWHPRGGRWAHQDEDLRGDFWQKLLTREPYGAKSNHANFSIWTHGNGLFEYEPVLKSGCGDFDDGVFDHRNAELTEEGITLARDGTGEVVFEVNSPYVIVPKVGELRDRADDSEASVVQYVARGDVRISISLDFGRSWSSVEPSITGTVDLTPWLRERYQYLLKFTLTGKRGDVALRSLRMRTWVQLAPASLPRLKKGVNRLTFKTGDKRGLATTPWMQTPFLGDRNELSRYWNREPSDYEPDRFQQRVKGDMELAFAAPPGRRIEWMSLGGFFAAHRRDRAKLTANEIWYAVNDSDDWQQLYKASVPDWNDHWHYGWDGDVVLDKPAESVRVRYIGDPGVNAVRVNLHSSGTKPAASAPVEVTHGYEIDGQLLEKRFTFENPAKYSIDCPSAPRNVFIAMQLPSDAATDQRDVPKQTSTPDSPDRESDAPDWVSAMRKVHAKYDGKPGIFAQFGDSITDSRAFWSSVRYKRVNASPEVVKAFQLVSSRMIEDCWDRKGPANGNQGGRTIRWAHRNVSTWLT